MTDQVTSLTLANLLLAIPLLPLLGATLLMLAPLCSIKLPKAAVTAIALGAMLAAVSCTFLLSWAFADQGGQNFSHNYANWLQVGTLSISFGLHLDALSQVMISIVTGVGLLIHLYSVGFMDQDRDYQRFFAYLNLFVAAMLILVLADNLVLLYLGWEGVGLCSYLLIGFWHEHTENNLAANKAFIMTRIGDAGMALGLFLLFVELGTLNIQQLQINAAALWPLANAAAGSGLDTVTICCLLLLAGAVGKSGQLPLQSWLPDAMAGPTPVSALIHAATMVTAGVYLIARCHGLFELSPLAMQCVAAIGAATLFLAASAALVQTDVKRILAYSTVSQIGYMFLALGAGAWSAAVFHLMTHAFFKALLFLSAGALIYSLHHEHNIFRMGGLAKKLPLVCGCFLVGCAALASLPLMSGFFSKELILEKLLEQGMTFYWSVALIGAFMTAFYSFRLFFVVFLGQATQEPDHGPTRTMIIPLVILALLAVFGGIQPKGLEGLFGITNSAQETHSLLLTLVTIAVPLCAVGFAWVQFCRGAFGRALQPGRTQQLQQFLLSGWAVDWLYRKLFIKPFIAFTHLNRNDFVDRFYTVLVSFSESLNRLFSWFQNGRLRWYTGSLVVFGVAALSYTLSTL